MNYLMVKTVLVQVFSALTLLGSKSSLTVKLSTIQEARLCSTQARTSSTRANIWESILGNKKKTRKSSSTTDSGYRNVCSRQSGVVVLPRVQDEATGSLRCRVLVVVVCREDGVSFLYPMHRQPLIISTS